MYCVPLTLIKGLHCVYCIPKESNRVQPSGTLHLAVTSFGYLAGANERLTVNIRTVYNQIKEQVLPWLPHWPHHVCLPAFICRSYQHTLHTSLFFFWIVPNCSQVNIIICQTAHVRSRMSAQECLSKKHISRHVENVNVREFQEFSLYFQTIAS